MENKSPSCILVTKRLTRSPHFHPYNRVETATTMTVTASSSWSETPKGSVSSEIVANDGKAVIGAIHVDSLTGPAPPTQLDDRAIAPYIERTIQQSPHSSISRWFHPSYIEARQSTRALVISCTLGLASPECEFVSICANETCMRVDGKMNTRIVGDQGMRARVYMFTCRHDIV